MHFVFKKCTDLIVHQMGAFHLKCTFKGYNNRKNCFEWRKTHAVDKTQVNEFADRAFKERKENTSKYMPSTISETLAHLFMRLYETGPPKCHVSEIFVFKCPLLVGNKVKTYLDIDPRNVDQTIYIIYCISVLYLRQLSTLILFCWCPCDCRCWSGYSREVFGSHVHVVEEWTLPCLVNTFYGGGAEPAKSRKSSRTELCFAHILETFLYKFHQVEMPQLLTL